MLHWRWFRFAELGVEPLYELLALRSRVFVVEQNCPYLDADGIDRHAWHLLGRDDAGGLQACLRVVDPGAKFAEPSIGRVVTSPDARSRGLGRPLMSEGIRQCEALWPGRDIRISAQAHLARFYGSLGFEAVGEPYLDDNIPHQDMLRRSR